MEQNRLKKIICDTVREVEGANKELGCRSSSCVIEFDVINHSERLIGTNGGIKGSSSLANLFAVSGGIEGSYNNTLANIEQFRIKVSVPSETIEEENKKIAEKDKKRAEMLKEVNEWNSTGRFR